MIYYAFLVLAIASTIVSSEVINGLDKDVFQRVKEVTTAKGPVEENFIETIWSELSRSLPESAKLPGIELSFTPTTEADLEKNGKKVSDGTAKGEYWFNNYICASESKIYPKLAETVSTKGVTKVNGKTVEKKAGRTVVEVNVKFSNEKTMDYKIYQKLGGFNSAKGPVSVSYKFTEESNVRLILDIPETSKLSTIPDASCLVNIRGVEVNEVTTLSPVNTLEEAEEEIVEHYWNAFGVKDLKDVMSIGVRRAINLKLKNQRNYWLCLSEDFKDQAVKDEDQYTYNKIYNEFCKDAKIAD